MTRVPLSSAIKLAVDNGYDHPDSPRVRARYAGAELNQFAGAETIAARYEISREMLDRFGFESHRRAVQATASGAFEPELQAAVVVVCVSAGDKGQGEQDGGNSERGHCSLLHFIF